MKLNSCQVNHFRILLYLHYQAAFISTGHMMANEVKTHLQFSLYSNLSIHQPKYTPIPSGLEYKDFTIFADASAHLWTFRWITNFLPLHRNAITTHISLALKPFLRSTPTLNTLLDTSHFIHLYALYMYKFWISLLMVCYDLFAKSVPRL